MFIMLLTNILQQEIDLVATLAYASSVITILVFLPLRKKWHFTAAIISLSFSLTYIGCQLRLQQIVGEDCHMTFKTGTGV